ncbi:YicC family protein [Halobacillus fulvus]|nr:YicC family protein [Halobacillus fulvus]
MVKSMTGYGKGSVNVHETDVNVEVRSVNHRFLDIAAKLPRNLLFIEEKLKRQVKDSLSRGRVDLFVTIEGQGLFEKKVEVDWSLLDQYMEKLEEVKGRYELTGDVSIDMVTKLENIFSVQEVEEDTGELQEALLTAVETALHQLVSMREAEGGRLRDDLYQRTETMEALLGKLEERRPFVVEEQKERILKRLEELMRDTMTPDESRVLQEVGLLADKSDVTEELTRLDSHVNQFREALKQEGPVGRRLDFIVQEMLREVNTIGSKSNDAKVTGWVVSLKSEIEKMKEQVQNVE